MADNKTIIKIKEEPILIRMTGKGVPGRTGPAGAKGDDGITWELALIMEDSPNGQCTMRLFKDGVLCTQETHYAYVQLLYHNERNFTPSSEFSQNITGTYSFSYTNVRSIFVTIYEDSFMEKALCSNSANYGRSATIEIGNVQQGAQAAVTNVGNPIDAVFDITLPKGDQGEVSVAETETLPAGSAAYVQDLLPNDPNRARLKFGIPNGGGSGARVEGRKLILDAGAIFTPSVSSAGVLSWSNNASLPNPESINIKGPAGTSATITAGTASSLPSGSTPTVTNSGTSSNAVFNFGIPKGDTGAKGDKGAKGDTATVTIGTVTTGAAGSNATVVNSGTANDAVLDFTLPRGADGDGYMGAQYDGTEEGVIFEVAENMLSDMAFEDDAPSNNKEYIRKNGAWTEPTAPAWGSITGTLSNQTDLQNALSGKSDVSHTHATLENIAAVYDSSSESLTLTI